MANKKDFPTLIVSIILCLVFVPAAIYGTINKVKSSNNTPQSTGSFYYDGTLNFYDNGTLIGTYNCLTKSATECGYAESEKEDGNIDYYQDGTKTSYNTLINVGPLKLALIKDNNQVILQSIKANSAIAKYDAIKFYNTDTPVILTKTNGKWSAINLNTMVKMTKEYDYLGLKNSFKDNILNTDIYIAKENGFYALIDFDGNLKSAKFTNQIYSYSDTLKVIATLNNNKYSLSNYEGTPIFTNLIIKDIILTDNYLGIVTSSNSFQVYKGNTNTPIATETFNNYTKISGSETTNGLVVKIDDKEYKTY